MVTQESNPKAFYPLTESEAIAIALYRRLSEPERLEIDLKLMGVG